MKIFVERTSYLDDRRGGVRLHRRTTRRARRAPALSGFVFEFLIGDSRTKRRDQGRSSISAGTYPEDFGRTSSDEDELPRSRTTTTTAS